jgi:hypothetical protein
MKPFVGPLATALGHLQEATMWLMRNAPATPDNAAAGATDYMHLMGLVALAYMWCRIVEAARARLAVDETAAGMRGKLALGRFFVERMLPETAVHLARIRLGAANVMELPAEAF